MRKTAALVLVIVFLISLIACTKENTQQTKTTQEFDQGDVRNRNLKEAIENYNNGFFKAADSSVNKARSQQLRDEDITILNELDMKIDDKTKMAVFSLDSLSVKGNLHDYDFAYNSIHSNYEISTFRQHIEESKIKYMKRVKKENDTYLDKYYTYLKELESKTNLSIESSKKVYLSKTNPLKLKIIIDGYEQPQAFIEFYPSQKEPELETVKFTSPSYEFFLKKGNLKISEYNLSTTKIIPFDLSDAEAELNMSNLKEMLDEGQIKIALKWFYEPERITVSSKDITSLKSLLETYQHLYEEYKANSEHIYVPKYVK